MKQELVSIIIPVYNAERTIERCIESLLNQTYREFEIILIDDGSKDASKEICECYAENNEYIRYYHQENRGVSAARNLGMKKCSGDYIGFVDSDDYVEPQYIEEMFDSSVDMSICSCNDILLEGKVIKVSKVHEEGVFEKKEINFQTIYQTGLLGVCWGKLYKRELLDNLKFDEKLMVCEDTLFVNQYYAKAQKVKLVGNINYHYTVGNSASLNNTKYSIRLLDMHKTANDLSVECLAKDKNITEKDLEFKRDLFWGYYADYFYYFLFQSSEKIFTRRKILLELYKKEYFKEFEKQIDRVLSKENVKYRKILLLKNPLLEIILTKIIKRRI